MCWVLTKDITHKLQIAQRALERKLVRVTKTAIQN